MIKREPGVHLHSVQVKISVKVYLATMRWAAQITLEMSQADDKMEMIVKG